MARSIHDTVEVQKCCFKFAQADSFIHNGGVKVHMLLESKNANNTLKYFFLFQNPSSLDDSPLALTSVLNKPYNLFGFVPLHNVRLSISKLQKECTFKFLGSDRVVRKLSKVVEQRELLNQVKMSILRSVDFLRVTIDRDTGVHGLHVDISSKVLLCS